MLIELNDAQLTGLRKALEYVRLDARAQENEELDTWADDLSAGLDKAEQEGCERPVLNGALNKMTYSGMMRPPSSIRLDNLPYWIETLAEHQHNGSETSTRIRMERDRLVAQRDAVRAFLGTDKIEAKTGMHFGPAEPAFPREG